MRPNKQKYWNHFIIAMILIIISQSDIYAQIDSTLSTPIDTIAIQKENALESTINTEDANDLLDDNSIESTDSLTIPDSTILEETNTVLDSNITTASDTVPDIELNANTESISVEKETADSTNTGEGINDIITIFNKTDIELKRGEIVSNVLKVINNTDEEKEFTIDVVSPGSWTQLIDRAEVYIMAPGDTLIVPVILVPSKTVNGNTNVMINVFLIDTDQYQLANNYFTLSTTKHVSWDIKVAPSNKQYFLNDQNTKDFEFTASNTGTYKQDIFLEYRASKSDILLLDSLNNIVKKTNLTINLEPRTDTTFKYTAKAISRTARNFKKVSLNNHKPNTNLEYRKHSLFINSSEPKAIGESTFKRGNKVDFIKLPNEIKFTKYGHPALPLVVELNTQNLLSDYSFMSLNMRGFHQLNDDASISYTTQINYSLPYWNRKLFDNTPWHVGYYDRHLNAEAGQVSGNIIGMPSFGKGLKASFSYLEKHKTGAFYVRSPGFFKPMRSESYGAFHKYVHSENFNITAKIGRNINYLGKTEINVVSAHPNFNFLRRHYFSGVAALTNSSGILDNPRPSKNGYLVGLNYSTHFFDKNLRVSLGGRYNNKDFSLGSFERLTLTHRSSYKINEKWTTNLSNSYQEMTSVNTSNGTPFSQNLFFNKLTFITKNHLGSFQPGAFYDITDYQFNRVRSRGVSLRHSKQSFKENFLTSAFFKAGYRKSIDIPEAGNYFTFEFSSLLRYKVWSLTTRYNYGALSNASVLHMISDGITPQSLNMSFQNQYLFKNNHFVLENNLIYNFRNRFSSHSFGIHPEVYYFSNNGWRFSLSGNYNVVSNDYSSSYTQTNYGSHIQENPDKSATVDQNVTIGMGIKKEFGIPIPFTKKKAASLRFVSFYDINGNSIKEKDEPAIENVVVRFGTQEVITNADGIAHIRNIPATKYSMVVIALEKLEGWFANVPDSIDVFDSGDYFIPFVRGIKVYGDVVLDRQKIAVMDTDKKFDLSRIRVTASNGNVYNTLTDVDGKFEFYMPNGEYTITLDEGVLGNRYKLSRNNLPVSLKNTQDGVYVSFYIIENKRKIVVKEFGN